MEAPALSVVHVAGGVDGGGQFADLDLEALLDLTEHLLVLLALHEGDGEALGAKATSTAHSVQVAVRLGRHVEVEHDVNLLNVDTASENLSGDQDAVLESLEALVNLDSLLLWNVSVDGLRRNGVLVEDLGELGRVLNRFHEDDHLVKVKSVDQVNQLLDLLVGLEFHVVLLETVKC